MLHILFYLLLLLNGGKYESNSQLNTPTSDICLSDEEMKLYNLIMDYRVKNKLPRINLSIKLTEVAQIHARDLNDNHTFGDQQCNMHSWSNKGSWKGCCYTSDHSDPNCMWDKPKEINGYSSQGYEISYYNSGGITADDALRGWRESKSHNEVMINKGIWKQATWTAIGVGIYEGYTTVWFGMVADDKAERCE